MHYGDPSMALRRYAEGSRDAKVRFACAVCGSGHDVDARQVIWLLKALKLGDEQTPVSGGARLDDHSCVRCGGRSWQSWPYGSDAAG